jgi:hypothetical protein
MPLPMCSYLRTGGGVESYWTPFNDILCERHVTYETILASSISPAAISFCNNGLSWSSILIFSANKLLAGKTSRRGNYLVIWAI